MGARKLTRMQKASALVPMTLLVGAWAAALTNSGLATASGGISPSEIPDVPATAFEQPASVQRTPAGIDQKAGLAGTVSTLSTNGIPSSALYAYRRAETLLGKADPTCKLPWNLVAAIGRVESNHGRSDGNSLNADGVATPGIYGVALDGKDGRALIADTDSGALDKDAVYDHAVGPMQFIPGTWKSVGVDSDGDGKKDPQDIDDAATAAGIYLCAGTDDLSTPEGAAAAVGRYNHSSSYVDLVLSISAKYAQGDFTQSPNGFSSASVLTSASNDQTLTPDERTAAKKAETKASTKPRSEAGSGTTGAAGGGAGGAVGGTTAGGGGSTGGSGGSTGGSGTSGGSGSTGSSGGAGSTLGGGVQGLVQDTPLAPVVKPVTDLLTAAQANLQCTLTVSLNPLDTHQARFDACVYDLTH